MMSHLLLGMFAPLGLVLAAPVTLALRAGSPRARRATVRLLRTRPVRVLAHPVPGLVLSVGGLYAVLLTPVYASTAHDALLHQGLQLHYLAAGCLLTWSLVGPDPTPHRAGMPTRVAVLVAAAAGHAVLARYLYASAGRMAEPLMTDARSLQSAATLMYYGADAAELLLAVALFGSWYFRRGRRPARSRTADPTPHRVTP
jgi:putative membrane protein